jgi:hypothetical protein
MTRSTPSGKVYGLSVENLSIFSLFGALGAVNFYLTLRQTSLSATGAHLHAL